MEYIEGKSVFTKKNIRLIVDKDVIVSAKELSTSKELPYISPGFLDTQVNGYAGYDYNSENLKQNDIVNITNLLAASGTTQHFPTIITNSRQQILNNLKTISNALAVNSDLASAIPGIHIEGPYISSEEGPRGVHNPEYIRNPDYSEFLEWQKAAMGRIKQITMAPELPGALGFIQKVTSQNVVVSIGHTAAKPEIISQAIEAGARMSTHLGNGSHGLIPRLKNYIWEQMASDKLTASIISDGFHLPESVVKVLLRTKTLDRIILVSDVTSWGGMNPGIYKWGSIDVEVFKDGHLGLAGTEYLAGSGHLLNHSLPWLMNNLNISIEKAIVLCTVNPSKIFFPDIPIPLFNPGNPANLILFNWESGNKTINVLKTWRKDRKIYI